MLSATIPPARAKIVPVIVVPGITASALSDWYPSSPREIWSPARLALGDYEPMMLHPVATGAGDDETGRVRYEAQQPMLVRPTRAFGIIYDDLVEELRHDLACDDVPVTPVYVFAYDWRQDNFVTMRRLAGFIDEVIERTRLMPHDPAYVTDASCDGVDLVGHSMGGNLIAACLASGLVGTGAECRVRRVVTLGTPFRGAPAAITKLATGLGSLTGRGARERERSAARITPSVYQLLPTYPGAVVRRAEAASRAVGAEGWPSARRTADETPHESLEDIDVDEAIRCQPSILESLSVFLRRHVPATGSLDDPVAASTRARELLDGLLAQASRFTSLVERVRPEMLRAGTGGWLVIAGAGESTHVRCEVMSRGEGPELDFTRGHSDDSWDGEGWDTGDDTVPMRSAAPPWSDGWRDMVVVRRSDFDWLGELGDRVLLSQLGLHAMLPRLNLAQRWIVNFLRPEWMAGETAGYRQHGTLWAGVAPGFWQSERGTEIRDQVRRSPDRREEIVRSTVQDLWSAKLPGIRLSPARGV